MVRFHRGSPAKNKASLLGGFAFGVPGSEFQVPSETFKSKEQVTGPPVWGAFSFVSIVTANHGVVPIHQRDEDGRGFSLRYVKAVTSA